MFTTLIAAALTGIAVGILSGMVGVGGGTVLLPLFRLAFGLSPYSATATSLFTVIPTSISGAVSHIRGKTCIPKLGIALGIGGACASPLGVWIAQLSPGWLVMVATACAIAYSGATMLHKAIGAPKPKSAQADGEDKPVAMPLDVPHLVKAALIGAIAGLASGYIGLGGGFLMIPLMLSVLHLPMKQASGTSLIAIMILATPATVLQCLLGNVDYAIGIATVCGTVPGAILGAHLMRRVPERALRLVFALFLIVASALLVAKEAGLLA